MATMPSPRHWCGSADAEDSRLCGPLRLGGQAQAVELLCRCDDIPDDNVELAVLKGLLTAVTSSTLHIHGQVHARAQPPPTPKLCTACMITRALHLPHPANHSCCAITWLPCDTWARRSAALLSTHSCQTG